MGRYIFKLPDVGEGTAEAEIVTWHVAVGDHVAEDQHLVDVMTDKATVEMTCPVSGTIVSLNGQPGEMAVVGAPLVEFEIEGAAAVTPPATKEATTVAPAPPPDAPPGLSPPGGPPPGRPPRAAKRRTIAAVSSSRSMLPSLLASVVAKLARICSGASSWLSTPSLFLSAL